MSYYYDAAGNIEGFSLDGMDYWYIKNVPGDIVRIVNQAQETVAVYRYDTWGKLLGLRYVYSQTLKIFDDFKFK